MPYLVVYNEDTLRRVMLEGYEAQKQGKKPHDNPHNAKMALCSMTLAAAWFRGHLLASTGLPKKKVEILT